MIPDWLCVSIADSSKNTSMRQPPTPFQSIARRAKTKNIIDMSLTFSATLRVFSSQSKAMIAKRLEELFADLEAITDREKFEGLHAGFCAWFTSTIGTAAKKGKRSRPSGQSSYGHAAKILDVSAKVFVYFCAQPSHDVAGVIIPMLHCPADAAILKRLTRLPNAAVTAKTINEIDRDRYEKLQALVCRDIAENFRSEILPVEYDDIIWNQRDRSDS
jgi:hypothetical protein